MESTLLIVDDSRISRKIVRRCLPEGLKAEVLEAGGGAEALSICDSRKIDVMFLDLTMPDVDGYMVLEELKKHPDPPAVFVISGDVQPRAQLRVLMLGAEAFVKKPINAEKMQQVLAETNLI